jgi:hypothetical protein
MGDMKNIYNVLHFSWGNRFLNGALFMCVKSFLYVITATLWKIQGEEVKLH